MAKLPCIINSSYYAVYLMVMIITLNSLPISHSETPSYLKFVSNATTFPSEDYYDYVIVGGGTAGCPLAATLSEKYRVLVLERGGVPYGRYNVMNEDGFLALFNDGSSDSPVQPFVSEDGVLNARGRVLGGSSAVNLGFYSRADQEFFETSGMEWDFGLVNQSYEWVENEIVFEPELNKWQRDFRDALLHAGVEPYHGYTLDHVVGTKISGSTFDQTGKRHCAADLLSNANPENIRVAVYASAERIILDASNHAAIGVDFSDEAGNYHRALVRENGEILISAGSLGSPQLLLLSGIGPSHYLSSKGIPVSHHSPYVGRFMYDNPRTGISIVSPIPFDQSNVKVVGVSSPMTYLESVSSIVPRFLSPESPPIELPVATINAKIGGPVSSGSLRLASRDVRKNPLVKFNYYSSPTDLHRCVNNTWKLAELLSSPSLRDYKINYTGTSTDDSNGFKYFGEALPPIDQLSDTRVIEQFCHRTVGTMWHHHGGCLVGKVVDEKLKVIGIDSLRVVDASLFRVAPGTNPQAGLMMLGRYIGVQMLNERMGTSSI